MRYLGSKFRLTKYILPHIHDALKPGMIYYEPFVGSGSLFCMVEHDIRIGSDANRYTIGVLRAIRDGWIPPDTFSETNYTWLKKNYKTLPDSFSHIVGFAGFGCSFSGIFFSSYARDANNGNYAGMAKRKLLKMRPGLLNTVLIVRDYRFYDPYNSVVYADPPYADSAPYKEPDGSTQTFDSAQFWRTMKKWSEPHRNNVVLCSERQAPDDCTEILWEKEYQGGLRSNNPKPPERLYRVVHKKTDRRLV